MVIDLICETSERMLCNVPVFNPSCRGIEMEWTGGPSCRNLT